MKQIAIAVLMLGAIIMNGCCAHDGNKPAVSRSDECKGRLLDPANDDPLSAYCEGAAEAYAYLYLREHDAKK